MAVATASILPFPGRNFDLADRLIAALDVPTEKDAWELVEKLDGIIRFFKIGLQLQLLIDRSFIERLLRANKQVFIDYKYNDIENTVESAVRTASDMGVDFVTVHGLGKIIAAAMKGRGSRDTKIFIVTLLTSLEQSDLMEMGSTEAVKEIVLRRTKFALDSGCDGVIASGQEVADIRATFPGSKLLIVAPGIRQEGQSKQDQKRTATPREAIRAGADYLVIGRQLSQAQDPAKEATKIIEEMRSAFSNV
jgi:orotidine-5'-phosphate decarboxylase